VVYVTSMKHLAFINAFWSSSWLPHHKLRTCFFEQQNSIWLDKNVTAHTAQQFPNSQIVVMWVSFIAVSSSCYKNLREADQCEKSPSCWPRSMRFVHIGDLTVLPVCVGACSTNKCCKAWLGDAVVNNICRNQLKWLTLTQCCPHQDYWDDRFAPSSKTGTMVFWFFQLYRSFWVFQQQLDSFGTQQFSQLYVCSQSLPIRGTNRSYV